jgi:hypothetical protein
MLCIKYPLLMIKKKMVIVLNFVINLKSKEIKFMILRKTRKNNFITTKAINL